MRDPKRIKVITQLLRAYWEGSPDLRLGQIIVNLAPDNRCDCGKDPDVDSVHDFTCAYLRHPDPYNVEDDAWEEALVGAIRGDREARG